jgi:cathepsin A (carboxypeptidase C)
MVERLPTCKKLAMACQQNTTLCVAADDYCNLAETTPYYNTGLNPYDIRVPCGESDLCYDFTNVETFMNLGFSCDLHMKFAFFFSFFSYLHMKLTPRLESTREALHVSDKVETWKTCNNFVNVLFASDWMQDYQETLIPMLENGIRVLIYAGDVDFICNWIGNKAWTQALNWSGKRDFSSENDEEWYYSSEGGNETLGGYARSAKAFSGKDM